MTFEDAFKDLENGSSERGKLAAELVSILNEKLPKDDSRAEEALLTLATAQLFILKKTFDSEVEFTKDYADLAYMFINDVYPSIKESPHYRSQRSLLMFGPWITTHLSLINRLPTNIEKTTE